MALLEVGKEAPDFTIPSDDGSMISLKDLRGKIVVLYFYPKDFTPGCTTEACTFRDDYGALQEAGITVIGISYDPVEKHSKFRAKYKMPFNILSDTDKKVSMQYGTNGVLVNKRITYIIGRDGKILMVYPKVNVKTHSKEVLEFVKSLKQ